MSKVVGIDLGTTNSLVAYVKDGVPVVIRDASGDALVPSVVSVAEDGTIYVGREAQRRLLTDASRTVYSVKRFMGKGVDDVQRRGRACSRSASRGEAGGVVRIGLGEREFTPPEISAFILRELKHRAEAFFAEQGEVDPEVDRAVITVPAYFNDAQRTATRDAGRIAGLEVLRIINEPTAASLAYGLDKRHTGIIAVYDFGGGTFDISILRVEDGVFQVLVDQRRHAPRRRRHRPAADEHGARGDDSGPASTGAASRRAGRPAIVESCRRSARRSSRRSGTCPSATRREIRRRRLPRRAASRATEFEALIRADRRPHARSRAARRWPTPGSSRRRSTKSCWSAARRGFRWSAAAWRELFGRTPHSELNPDEVVALGAAVQADILVTGNRDMLLLDVTPLSLGIETMGGVMSKIILRNSTIPATGSEMFTTGVDNQTAVDIHVLQGERELVADNRSLARFKLRGIPPMPAGMPRVQVQFQIDANGILSVTARELRTEVEQTIEVKPSYGLTDDEVERMLLDSFEHAEADFAARLLIEARNEAETVIQATEKSLRGARVRRRSRRPSSPPASGSGSSRSLAGSEDGAELDRSRDDSEMDAGAERRDAAPGRGDDEPHPSRRRWPGRTSTTCSAKAQRTTAVARRLQPSENIYAQSHVHHRRRDHRPSSSSTASCRTRTTASPSRFSTSPRTSTCRSSTPAAAAAPARPATSSSAKAQQNLSEMQDDEADRLDTAWGLTRAVAPRLPGGHHGRRRLRAADVHPQLRAGRRRHPAREVRQEGAQGARRCTP